MSMGTTTPSMSLAADVDTIPGIDEATRVVLRRLRGQGFDGTNLSLHRQQLAAVLVLLYSDSTGSIQVLLTTRSKSLRSHPGQTALPGGRIDEEDREPKVLWGAFREAYEEVGLPFPSSLIIDSDNDIPHIPNIHILCTLSPHISQWGIIVVPVVAYLSGPVSSSASPPPSHTYILTPTLTLQANPTEVDRIFTHPLESILDPFSPQSTLSSRNLAEKGSEDWPYEEELYNYTDRLYPQLSPNHNNNTDTTDNIPSSIYRMHRFRSVASPIKGLTAEILVCSLSQVFPSHSNLFVAVLLSLTYLTLYLYPTSIPPPSLPPSASIPLAPHSPHRLCPSSHRAD
ncbi:hypothetical protein C8J55DRAFT_556020 [Lentinula edodes]|uniref:Nudix hydrolase domain-containing protein n=1 Tax=Lentinula lateritia TaxID=40482 RepID=A0A9W9AY43_9AGAR|nr:hypothetical protein C8J55DRAFT_556020 [Lentinula edodes]